MKPTLLKLRQPPPIRIDASTLHDVVAASQSELILSRILLPSGRQTIPLGELFAVELGDPHNVRVEGDLSQFDRIGSYMQRGTIHLEGSVGDLLGMAMRGGQILVNGNAGDLAAADMRGGKITIHGSVGDEAGGPLRGSTKGMRGGTLKVGDSAGVRLGYRLRRGTIFVGGNCGDDMAMSMIAGTIAVLGDVGRGSGRGMKRGTILTLKQEKLEKEVSFFSLPHKTELNYLSLLFKELPELKTVAVALASRPTIVWRRIGDLTANGQGEWLSWY